MIEQEFPRKWAMGLIEKMQGYFGARFDNTYPKRNGMSDEQYMENLISICCEIMEGMTPDHIKFGLQTMRTAKFCPVFTEFREWCEDYVKQSYKPKTAALANINAWMGDSSVSITNAEREAYNRVYDMFNQLQWANNYEKAKYYAFESFKETYTEVVKEFIKKGELQSIWIEPPKIESRPVVKVLKKDYLNILTPEDRQNLENTEAKVKELVASGMSHSSAILEVLRGNQK
jgi:hypothetical protein